MGTHRTQKIPLMGVWDRAEYLQAKQLADSYNQKKAVLASTDVLCSFCKNKITDNHIHVVEYGEKIACLPCFKARYRNRRQLYKHVPVPPDLNDDAEPVT